MRKQRKSHLFNSLTEWRKTVISSLDAGANNAKDTKHIVMVD